MSVIVGAGYFDVIGPQPDSHTHITVSGGNSSISTPSGTQVGELVIVLGHGSRSLSLPQMGIGTFASPDTSWTQLTSVHYSTVNFNNARVVGWWKFIGSDQLSTIPIYNSDDSTYAAWRVSGGISVSDVLYVTGSNSSFPYSLNIQKGGAANKTYVWIYGDKLASVSNTNVTVAGGVKQGFSSYNEGATVDGYSDLPVDLTVTIETGTLNGDGAHRQCLYIVEVAQ